MDCTDIGNLIGKTVVAGNVRRSAELALGSADDHAFITMKQDQDKLYHHRWASNNSVAVDSNFDNYDEVADALRKNGEPGIVNLDLSKTTDVLLMEDKLKLTLMLKAQTLVVKFLWQMENHVIYLKFFQASLLNKAGIYKKFYVRNKVC